MDERRGLVVRRVKGDGCVDVSVSSTSNDRFSAGKHKHLTLDIMVKTSKLPSSYSDYFNTIKLATKKKNIYLLT